MEYTQHVQPESIFYEEDSVSNFRSIFIGGIPLSSTYKQVLGYLENFDYVESLMLPRDRQTRQLKGYGKAVMASEDGVRRLVESDRPHRIGQLTVGISRWKSQDDYLTQKDNQVGKKVYVKFPASLSQTDLREYFTQNYGSIVSIDVKTDPHTRRFRNFCYVVFEEEYCATRAALHHRHLIKKKTVLCEMSKPAHLVKKAQNDKGKYKSIFKEKGDSTREPPRQNVYQTQNNLSKSINLVTSTYSAKRTSIQAIEGSPKTIVTTRTGASSQSSNNGIFVMGSNESKESTSDSSNRSNRMNKGHQFTEKISKRREEVMARCTAPLFPKPTSRLYSPGIFELVELNHLADTNIRFNFTKNHTLVY